MEAKAMGALSKLMAMLGLAKAPAPLAVGALTAATVTATEPGPLVDLATAKTPGPLQQRVQAAQAKAMTKAQAEALLALPRGRGRPTKEEQTRLDQARSLLGQKAETQPRQPKVQKGAKKRKLA
jgi:hypothetical protein